MFVGGDHSGIQETDLESQAANRLMVKIDLF